jgi:ABC-type branched-subunit amino acid transport system substrate-binding protein
MALAATTKKSLQVLGAAGAYEDTAKACKWEVDRINKSRRYQGLTGVIIKVSIAEDQGNPVTAANEAVHIITQNGVCAILEFTHSV